MNEKESFFITQLCLSMQIAFSLVPVYYWVPAAQTKRSTVRRRRTKRKRRGQDIVDERETPVNDLLF